MTYTCHVSIMVGNLVINGNHTQSFMHSGNIDLNKPTMRNHLVNMAKARRFHPRVTIF